MAQAEIFLAHISEDRERMQTVKEHLQGTAALAEAFAQPFGGGEQAKLAGKLHDIGKYSREFQHRLEGGPKVDHSTAGGKEAFQLRQIEAAFAVMGHHEELPDYGGHGGHQHLVWPTTEKGPGLQRMEAGDCPLASQSPLAHSARQSFGGILHPYALLLSGGCGLSGHRSLYGRSPPARRLRTDCFPAGQAGPIHCALVEPPK